MGREDHHRNPELLKLAGWSWAGKLLGKWVWDAVCRGNKVRHCEVACAELGHRSGSVSNGKFMQSRCMVRRCSRDLWLAKGCTTWQSMGDNT